MGKSIWLFALAIGMLAGVLHGQEPARNESQEPKKANMRPDETVTNQPEPFERATVEEMAAKCVDLETELGTIHLEMLPEVAPESVRSFLNLTATGALDTTTFSRVVKKFVIQGGNLSTSEKWSLELAKRMARKLPDEPNLIKHVRGVVSMARPDEANSATTHFFILLAEAPHLNGKFAAFARVYKGMEVAEAINEAPGDNDKPLKPVRIARAVLTSCPANK